MIRRPLGPTRTYTLVPYRTLCRSRGDRVTVVSSDKDLMQLVTDRVLLQDPLSYEPIGFNEVEKKFGVAPDKVVDVQALSGDSIDNVPGVDRKSTRLNSSH